MQLEEQFILYQHLPEVKRLLDFDNILLYIRAGNCLSENDIHKIETAEKVNTDKAVHELARLVKKRGGKCLERFFAALRRSAHEENHPGHTELLAILEKAVEAAQRERETEEESSFVSPDTVVGEPAEDVRAYEVQGAAVYTSSGSPSDEQTENVIETTQELQSVVDSDGKKEVIQDPVSMSSPTLHLNCLNCAYRCWQGLYLSLATSLDCIPFHLHLYIIPTLYAYFLACHPYIFLSSTDSSQQRTSENHLQNRLLSPPMLW